MLKVLIVDDSKAARMMLKHWVKAARPNCEIVEAGSGEEALGLLSSLTEDTLAVLDYNMPGITGIELATRILEKLPNGQVTLCTANVQEAIRQKARDLGIRYVAKPLNPGKVRELLTIMESG